MTQVDYLRPELCVAGLRGRDAPAVLLELCGVLQRSSIIADTLSFFEAVSHRHYLGETAAVGELAVVACTSPAALTCGVALGQTERRIEWRTGAKPVRLVLLAAAPIMEPSFFPMVWRAALSLARNDAIQARLESARDSAALFAVWRDEFPRICAAAGEGIDLVMPLRN